MKRSAMPTRRKRLRRVTPLRSRPSRRARPDELLAELCKAGIPCVCTGRAECRHHILRRSQGGGDDRDNTIDVCSACHRWVHDNPAAALVLGLLRRREAS